MTCDGALGQNIDKCAPREVRREEYQDENSKAAAVATQTSVVLSPKWRDSQILAAFGFANAVAERDRVPGVDGDQARYHDGKTQIAIVRSYSSGLAITVNSGRYRGAWLLDPCE